MSSQTLHKRFEGVVFDLSFIAVHVVAGFYARVELGMLLFVASNWDIKFVFER